MIKSILLFLMIVNNSCSLSDRIPLKDVKIITVNKNYLTNARRIKPMLQLHCGGVYCNSIKIDSMECINKGFNGYEYIWKCRAKLPKCYKFGFTKVICEGYDYDEDNYILKDSCGVNYNIIRDIECRMRHNMYNDNSKDQDSMFIFLIIFASILISVILIIILESFIRRKKNNRISDRKPNIRNSIYRDF